MKFITTKIIWNLVKVFHIEKKEQVRDISDKGTISQSTKFWMWNYLLIKTGVQETKHKTGYLFLLKQTESHFRNCW